MRPNYFRYSGISNVVLSRNSQHQFALNHALCAYKGSAIYSFIPKNACSTLRYSLAIYNGCLEAGGDINWIHKNNDTFGASLRDASTASYSFVVLRCPFRRLASVFLDKFVDKGGPAWVYYDMIGRESSLDDLTFHKLVSSLARESFLARDIHWRPQVDFLLYKNYSDVFSVENFGVAENVLREKLGFNVYDARQLTRHGLDQHSLITSGLWHHVPVKELYQLKMAGQLPAAENLYTRELLKIVGKIYAEDIVLYTHWCDKAGLMTSGE